MSRSDRVRVQRIGLPVLGQMYAGILALLHETNGSGAPANPATIQRDTKSVKAAGQVSSFATAVWLGIQLDRREPSEGSRTERRNPSEGLQGRHGRPTFGGTGRNRQEN